MGEVAAGLRREGTLVRETDSWIRRRRWDRFILPGDYSYTRRAVCRPVPRYLTLLLFMEGSTFSPLDLPLRRRFS